MQLQMLVPGKLWHAQCTLKFGPLPIKTRMTVIRIESGSLWVHSPVPPNPQLVEQLGQIGSVRYVVAPNKGHHLSFLPFLAAFPEAQGFVAPGLAERRPDLSAFPVLNEETNSLWAHELQPLFVQGLPIINETIWFHASTKTLVLTDFLCCFGPENDILTRLAARVLGVYGRLGLSRTMRMMVRDRSALAQTVNEVMRLDFERIILAHDQIIERDAKSKLKAAFDWLPH